MTQRSFGVTLDFHQDGQVIQYFKEGLIGVIGANNDDHTREFQFVFRESLVINY